MTNFRTQLLAAICALLAFTILTGCGSKDSGESTKVISKDFKGSQITTKGTAKNPVERLYWSSDNKLIQYTVTTSEILETGSSNFKFLGELWSASVDNKDSVKKIADNATGDGFSADGKFMLYRSLQTEKTGDLHILKSDGTPVAQVKDIDWVGTGFTVDNNIVYQKDHALWLADSNGETIKKIRDVNYLGINERNLYPSPDGDWVAYANGTELHLLSTRNSDEEVLSESYSGDPLAVSWTNDSKKVAFTTSEEINVGLWVKVVGTPGMKQLAKGTEENWTSISISDNKIYFEKTPVGADVGSEANIAVVNIEDTQLSYLTKNSDEERKPRVSPDGKSLIFVRDYNIWIESLE